MRASITLELGVKDIKQGAINRLIASVRYLRGIAAFQISTRLLVIFLMVLGTWVATRDLDVPLGFRFEDKFKHIFIFFGFSFLMDLATSRHPFWLWKGLPLLVYGLVIEIMQYFSPDRTFSLLDWIADFFGILLFFILKLLFLWVASIKQTNK